MFAIGRNTYFQSTNNEYVSRICKAIQDCFHLFAYVFFSFGYHCKCQYSLGMIRNDIVYTLPLIYKYFYYGRIWGYDIEFNSELIIVSTLRVYFEWHDNLSTCQVNNFCCIKLRMCVRQKNCAMKYSYITIAYCLCCIHSKKWKCYL